MNSATNRVRVIRDGRHCASCSEWVLRIADGSPVKQKNTRRGWSKPRHGRSKPKGQHAYRRGAL